MATPSKPSWSEQQVRLMIWTVPRSTSTVLSKCLSFVENSKVFIEIYQSVHFFDPTRGTSEFKSAQVEEAFRSGVKNMSKVEGMSAGIDTSKWSYQWAKEQLEKAYVGKKFILCKDMAYAVTDQKEFLPKGYRHVFLIRHPIKVFPSWKRVYQGTTKLSSEEFNFSDLPARFLPNGYGFQELYELFEFVKKELDQEAIAIDADDLLQDPKGILSALFKLIGLPFDEKILNWEAGSAVTERWTIPQFNLKGNQIGGYYQKAMESTCFLKPKSLPDRSSVSPDILRVVDASMPYYEKLHAVRLAACQISFVEHVTFETFS